MTLTEIGKDPLGDFGIDALYPLFDIGIGSSQITWSDHRICNLAPVRSTAVALFRRYLYTLKREQ